MPPWERRPVTGRGFSGLYLGFLAERADSVLAALRMIAYREGATLVHCTAGKDRTGTVIALALSDAGVEREAIIADYAASADHFDELMKRPRRVDRHPPTGALRGRQAPAQGDHDGTLPRRPRPGSGRGRDRGWPPTAGPTTTTPP